MSAFANLIFQEWQKPKQEFTIAGWRPREGLLFVQGPDGAQRVLRLVPLVITEIDRQTATSVKKDQTEVRSGFPDCPPVTITAVRWMPPPCRANLSEAETLRQRASEPKRVPAGFGDFSQPGWELARLRYDAEVLVPEPADHGEFVKSLERVRPHRWEEYNARKIELAELTVLVNRGQSIVGRARYYYSDLSSLPENSHAWKLEQERRQLEAEFPLGCLTWTVADAQRRPGIRNPILRARWAKGCGLLLEDMAVRRRQFFSTLPSHMARDVLDSMVFRRIPNFMQQALGHPKCYRPLDDLVEAPESFGAVTEEQLILCAQVQWLVTFDHETQIPLTDCLHRAPQNQGERQEFNREFKVIEHGQAQMLTKLDSVEKKTDQVWSGVQTLTERAGEEATTREQWHENPLGSGQAVADYLLTMDSMRIERGIAVALVRFGYGASRKQCAEDAGVSESTIKRALKMARQTPYAKFFARTRLQKRKALAAMKKPDEKFAVLRQLAEKDPDKLRAWIEQMILKAQAQGESDKGSAWDQTVDGLS